VFQHLATDEVRNGGGTAPHIRWVTDQLHAPGALLQENAPPDTQWRVDHKVGWAKEPASLQRGNKILSWNLNPNHPVVQHVALSLYYLSYVILKCSYQSTWRSRIRASWYNYENNQQDALYRLIYYSNSILHVSGDVFAHHQEHLTVFIVFGSVHPSCCLLNQKDTLYRLIYYSNSTLQVSGDVSAHHQEHLTVFTVSGSVHPSCCRLPATWVNTTRYCKYSQILLMMDENIARNM
jgi:hypothetical protein